MNIPTRAQFVEAARTYALAYGRQDDAPGYLPRTVNDAQAFEPHAWVIGAMMQAFSDGVKDGRDAERAELQFMPILGTTLLLPMKLLDERQAQANHGGQTLARLAERGGLSLNEAACIASGSKFVQMEDARAHELLKRAAGRLALSRT